MSWRNQTYMPNCIFLNEPHPCPYLCMLCTQGFGESRRQSSLSSTGSTGSSPVASGIASGSGSKSVDLHRWVECARQPWILNSPYISQRPFPLHITTALPLTYHNGPSPYISQRPFPLRITTALLILSCDPLPTYLTLIWSFSKKKEKILPVSKYTHSSVKMNSTVMVSMTDGLTVFYCSRARSSSTNSNTNSNSLSAGQGSPRRRSSVVVIPPMQICPGDLLVYGSSPNSASPTGGSGSGAHSSSKPPKSAPYSFDRYRM